MPEFTKEELNLVYLYDPGNLRGLIYELRAMMGILMPDEKDLHNLTEGTIAKLEKMTTADYKALCESMDPEENFLHFDLGLDEDLADNIDKTED